MDPFFSVVIPTYNRATYLKIALQSVFAQTFKDFEIIVVDDGSTDDTAQIVNAHPSIKYHYVNTKERAFCRNLGIQKSVGKYIAFLDSDDAWLPHHLHDCFLTIRETGPETVVYGGSYRMNINGKLISKLKIPKKIDDFFEESIKKFSSFGCNASSAVVPKNLLNKVRGFNTAPMLSGSEDWELWIRLAAETKLICTKKYSVKIRQHSSQTSQDAPQMERSMNYAFQSIFKNYSFSKRIQHLKSSSLAHLSVVNAIHYYQGGHMKETRKNLLQAARMYPPITYKNYKVIYTFLRSLLGKNGSYLARKSKHWVKAFLMKRQEKLC